MDTTFGSSKLDCAFSLANGMQRLTLWVLVTETSFNALSFRFRYTKARGIEFDPYFTEYFVSEIFSQ